MTLLETCWLHGAPIVAQRRFNYEKSDEILKNNIKNEKQMHWALTTSVWIAVRPRYAKALSASPEGARGT